MPAIRAGGFSVVSLPGSSRLWRSLWRLSRFPIALKLFKNRQATQASTPVIGQFFDTMIVASIDKEW